MYLVFWWFYNNNNRSQQPRGGSTLSVTVRSFWVMNKPTLVCLSLDRIPILFSLCESIIIQSLFYFTSDDIIFPPSGHRQSSQPTLTKQTKRQEVTSTPVPAFPGNREYKILAS
ncbi:hypothetical protein L873DRAFT_25104 [Choiromyces venosus 120613-1]|uniref:Uncharacterized protein n=1 Tax=Choiromyces venosus 120613-1 TaxID=1336337 RepID=A0A3N4KK00_9PEZI|nr:hypothetical protein L873DRAFT_25104 [Choiromyces venosus 120613-1]